MTPTTIKARLRRMRAHNPNITLSEIAEITGLTEKTWRRYESDGNDKLPSIGALAAVCQYYGLSVDHIAFGGGGAEYLETKDKWATYMTWWAANLTDAQKVLLMEMMDTIWVKSARMSKANPDLLYDMEIVKKAT